MEWIGIRLHDYLIVIPRPVYVCLSVCITRECHDVVTNNKTALTPPKKKKCNTRAVAMDVCHIEDSWS